MIESLHYIDGNVLLFITGAVEDTELYTICKHAGKNVIVARSPINCNIFNQDWAVVWAINNNINPEYVCFVDDDIEFTPESKGIIQAVEDCEPFSVCALANSAIYYRNTLDKTIWLDGCGLFAKFEDCIKYGVRDSNPAAAFIFYTGIEFQHRMRYFTGKPTVANNERIYYLHHQRADKDLREIRSEKAGDAFVYAGRFWKDKFGIELSVDPMVDRDIWEKLFELCSSEEYSAHFRKHLVFDGLWTDWEKIYKKYDVEVIYGV